MRLPQVWPPRTPWQNNGIQKVAKTVICSAGIHGTLQSALAVSDSESMKIHFRSVQSTRFGSVLTARNEF